MKIAVVSAYTIDSRYKVCVPFFLKQWERINKCSSHEWIPVVAFISDKHITIQYGADLSIDSMNCSSVNLEAPSSWVSQVIRLLLPGTLNADYVVTTDIDMLPLDLRVFEQALQELQGNSFDFVVCRDVLNIKQFPICYNVASPEVWRNLFPGSIPSQLASLWSKACKDFDGRRGKKGWYFDQELLYENLIRLEAAGLRLKRMQDVQSSHHRLEPTKRNLYLFAWTFLRILNGKFSDYHIHQPAPKYRVFIRLILMFSRFRFLFIKILKLTKKT